MADELLEELSINEDWEPEYHVRRRNNDTRVKESATGLASISAWISLTEDGAAISGTTAVLSEAAALPGRYFGLVEKAAIKAALTAYVGQTLYVVLDKPGDFTVSSPVKIVTVRTVL